jgi:hypothetical protein
VINAKLQAGKPALVIDANHGSKPMARSGYS